MLLDPLGDNIVASWSFSRLLNMWNNKHQRSLLLYLLELKTLMDKRIVNILGQ